MTASQLFNASSGDVAFAYTGRFHKAAAVWDETFLLNGFVEIVNLISWPLPNEMAYDAAQAQLTLPASRGVNAPASLNHTRHAMRVLLNQHAIPASLPVIGEANLIFNLAETAWQFLAVVEHQLVDVKPAANTRRAHKPKPAQAAANYALSHDRRWTATQEVRLLTPGAFRTFLQTTGSEDVTPPVFAAATLKATSVQQPADDVNETQEGFFTEIISPAAQQGLHWVGNVGAKQGYCGLHFRNAPMPRGARILNATLELVAANDTNTRIRLNIYGEAAGNSAAFSTASPPSQRTATQANLRLKLEKSDAWTHDQVQFLGDLAEVVQEIVNRADWNAGNDLSVILRGDGDETFVQNNPDARRFFVGVERNPQLKARLLVNYRPPTSQPTKLGYYNDELRTLLLDGSDGVAPELSDAALPKTLLVEASAPHWIQQQPLGQATLTTLQYLPFGSQLGTPSSPADFAMSDPQQPSWLLMTTPFLGRLQPQEANATGTSALQQDPILSLETRRASNPAVALPAVALALTSRADDVPLSFSIASFDAAAGRLFARLDPATLDESWMRLQHPIREKAPAGLQSVMAALPDTPARLSRNAALRQAFDPARIAYPPAPRTDDALPDDVTDAALVWRKGSLLVLQGFSPSSPAALRKYAWHLVGLLIGTSGLGRTSVASGPQRFAAATLLPAWQAADMPVSFAVSPYLSLGFAMRDAKATSHMRVLAAELLAIDARTGELRPVGSHFLEMDPKSLSQLVIRDDIPTRDVAPIEIGSKAISAAAEAKLMSDAQDWAREAHARLAPDSLVAVLRMRQINQLELTPGAANADRDALVTTTYAYDIVTDLALSETLTRRAPRLRARVAALRYRQGQFGGYAMPAALQAFELAPPQVIGVQPLYLTQSSTFVTVGDKTINAKWPWGFSGVRMSVQYTQDRAGVLGADVGAGAGANPLTLWWQAPLAAPQFRSAQSERPAASLPKLFRAKPIRSLLPTLPDAPLPLLDPDEVVAPPALSKLDEKVGSLLKPSWQPVLPGLLRHITVGARPGVYFFWRNQLLRQSGLLLGDGLVSGSVPVQHRMPRPVPLPPNEPAHQQYALQPWASYFEPTLNGLFTAAPADEVFLAACGDEPARRVRVQLTSPANGVIPMGWDGRVEFEMRFDTAGAEKPDMGSDWTLSATLLNSGQVHALTEPTQAELRLKLPKLALVLSTNVAQQLNASATDTVVQFTVTHTKALGMKQVLSLPLRFADAVQAPLPLEPVFAHFEDPEYNRALASQAGHATGLISLLVGGKTDTRAIALSSDRKEYNADSALALRYDWDDDREGDDANNIKSKRLTLSRITASSSVIELASWDKDTGEDAVPKSKQLMLISLAQVVEKARAAELDKKEADRRDASLLTIQPGDRLQLMLALFADNVFGGQLFEVALLLDVIEDPVTPMPEAAYALLQVSGAVPGDVMCARFAWSPEPQRIELVCPDDLKTELVRRRAVFHWQDAARRSRVARHAVQKITGTGSTHWPV